MRYGTHQITHVGLSQTRKAEKSKRDKHINDQLAPE